jgi:hypothetical protein
VPNEQGIENNLIAAEHYARKSIEFLKHIQVLLNPATEATKINDIEDVLLKFEKIRKRIKEYL